MELVSRDGLVTFLPHRLNRQPVVVRGLTNSELWICTCLFAGVGVAPGIVLTTVFKALAMIPTAVAVSVALGIFFGGGFLRRQKRNRPDTWLYRSLQMRLTKRVPALAGLVGGHGLITRSGAWATRRSRTLMRPA
jgi:conjugative transfer region protein (TIGR03750 family)